MLHCRTKKADAFTSRLLDLHSKMLEINKKEVIIYWWGHMDSNHFERICFELSRGAWSFLSSVSKFKRIMFKIHDQIFVIYKFSLNE